MPPRAALYRPIEEIRHRSFEQVFSYRRGLSPDRSEGYILISLNSALLFLLWNNLLSNGTMGTGGGIGGISENSTYLDYRGCYTEMFPHT